eukprot:3790005-Prymnesium_polylepis.1
MLGGSIPRSKMWHQGAIPICLVLTGRAIRRDRRGHGWYDTTRPSRIRWSCNTTSGGAALRGGRREGRHE